MTENDIGQLENYILNPKKEEFLKKLISGTDSYYYFTLLHALNTYGLNLPKEYEEAMNNYRLFSTPRSRGIQARYDLIQLEKSKDENAKVNIIKKVNTDFFHLDFSHQKPQHVTKSTLEIVQEKKSSILDDKILKIEPYIEKAYSYINDMQNLSPLAFPRLDLKRLAKSPENVISYFLNNARLAEFQDAPFLLKEYQILRIKSYKQYELDSFFFRQLVKEQMLELKKLCPNLERNKVFIGE